ncbi:MAG: hypothetical protein RL701_6933 [Pseudomonadota bacterium]
MKSTCLLLLASCAVGCEAINNTADDLTTISVGVNELSAVQFDKTMDLGQGDVPFPGCLSISVTLPSSHTTVAMLPTANGCSLTVHEPALVLLDEQEIAKAQKAVKGFDVDAVRSGRIELQKLALWRPDGSQLGLAQYIDAVTVQVDGEVLLDRIAPSALEGGADLTRDMPASIIDKLKASVKTSQSTTADISLTLWMHEQNLITLPGTLKLQAVLQPELKVNVVDAL